MNQNFHYNKDIIKKILYHSIDQNMEVLLSRTDTHKSSVTPLPSTDALIERITLYLDTQTKTSDSELIQNSQYYLVINYNQNEVVDKAYIGYLHYSNKYTIWKNDVLPLTHDKPIVDEYCHLANTLITTKTRLASPKIYHDINMSEAHISYILEHTKVRMKYLVLHKTNFEQYKLEVMHIYSQTLEDLLKTHQILLTNSINKYDADLQGMNKLQTSDDALSISGDNSNYDQQE